MSDITIVGIDPGVVHTGCVAITLTGRTVAVTYQVINGVDVKDVCAWLDSLPAVDAVFIEDYNPGNYGREDKRMSEALGRLKAALPPDNVVRYVDNAGINTLVPFAVRQVFGVDKFPVSTHHNDLVSAGKIALLGMLQDKEDTGLRQLVSRVVRDHLKNQSWSVVQHA